MSLVFGSADGLQASDSADWDGTHSLACWLKTTNSGIQTFLQHDSNGGTNGRSFQWRLSNNTVQFLSWPGPITHTGTWTDLNNGAWHFVGVVWHSTLVRMYRDLAAETKHVTPGAPAGASWPVDIGRRSNGTTAEFFGTLANHAWWNVALTDQEMAAMAKGVSPLSIRRGSLVAHWPLRGDFASVFPDEASSVHPMSAYSGSVTIGVDPVASRPAMAGAG